MPHVLQQAIQERAYALWEMEGRPDGRSVVHWLQAEQEALHGCALGLCDNGAPVKSPPPARRARTKTAG